MKEDTLSRRIVITFVIVLAILFLLSAIGYLLGRWDDASAAVEHSLQSVPFDHDEAHILALDREALDTAYKDHIKLVFGVWMKDPADPDAPKRAGNGARNARKGYIISRDKIEDRERKLKENK
jgi:hypothetical protein